MEKHSYSVCLFYLYLQVAMHRAILAIYVTSKSVAIVKPIELYHFVPCFSVGLPLFLSTVLIKRINFTAEEKQKHQTENGTLFNCSYAKTHSVFAHPFPGWKR